MAASQPGWFNFFALTNLSDLADGYRLYTYAPSTTTQKVAYTDAAGSISHTYTSDGGGGLYIALDARGELPAPLFLTSGGYDLTLKTAAGATVWTRRAYGASDGSDTLRADLADSTSAAKGAGLIAYDRDLAYAAGTVGASLSETSSAKAFGAVGDGVTNDTVAIQAWLTDCYTNEKAGYLPAGNYLVGALSLSITGNRLDKGLTLRGAGKNLSNLVQTGSPTALLTLTGTTTSAQLTMKDIGFLGDGKTCVGFRLVGIADFYIENCLFNAFTIGLDLQSALVGTVRSCQATSNNIGIKTSRSGVLAYCNNILFDSNVVNSNTAHGLDFGDANGITLTNNDIELNGVSAPTSTVTRFDNTIVWASHGLGEGDPVYFTTTGTLPAPLVPFKTYYVAGPVAGAFFVSETTALVGVTLTDAGTGTHTALSPNTGAVSIRSTCIDELGYSMFSFRDNWIEGNLGSGVVTEHMSNAFGFGLSIDGGHILGTTGGHTSLNVANARFVNIENHWNVSGPDVVNISADTLSIRNSYLITLNRPTVGYTTSENVFFNSVQYISGENGSYTGTATGMTTSPTGDVSYIINGKNVTAYLPTITGTSNATTFTVTGMPSRIRPLTAREVQVFVLDNNIITMSNASIGTDGVITFRRNGSSSGFTNSGVKGIIAATIAYTI